jgi:hypothetical protein
MGNNMLITCLKLQAQVKKQGWRLEFAATPYPFRPGGETLADTFYMQLCYQYVIFRIFALYLPVITIIDIVIG